MSDPADSLASFYAHALLIEREAAERYEELADAMDEHHNAAVAKLFRRLAGLEAEHARDLERRSAGLALPQIAPWDYRWDGFEPPETSPHEDVHYRMTPHHALKIALANELRAVAFFQGVAVRTSDPEVRALASTFVGEEEEHVGYVNDALAREVPPPPDWALDLDPPRPPD
ncbi:MAG: rubrerythrin [Betaproteobacteria bacterium]|nr:rubrerythrin [Betaproteobacteria bacterium]